MSITKKYLINKTMYPTNEQEYQADLDAQGEAEAELARQEYEYQEMLRERAIRFLTQFYGDSPESEKAGTIGENYITLIMSYNEWLDNKNPFK